MLLILLASASLLSPSTENMPKTHHQKDFDAISTPKETQLMTGTWGGGRTYLAEHGVTFSGSYVTDMVGNPVGGQAKGFAYAGSLAVSMDVDFGKACNWTGFEFFVDAVWRSGTSLSARKIDNAFSVQQVFGGQTVNLNELYFKETLFGGSLILKAGRLNAANDFLASPLYGEYVSNAIDGNPDSIFFNMPAFTVLPNATWGAYLAFKPHKRVFAQFGVYNANTKIFENRYHGTNFTFTSTNGVIWLTEWAFLVNPGSAYAGNYKAGFIYQTGNTQQFTNGLVHGDPSFYFLFDQILYQKRGTLSAFTAFLFAPQGRNTFPFFFMGGLVYKGLFPSRPKDTTNFGIAYGKYSRTLAAMERKGLFGALPQHFEMVLELNHWFQINDWFAFTPDIQYVVNPSGYGTIQNALVIGAQIGFDL